MASTQSPLMECLTPIARSLNLTQVVPYLMQHGHLSQYDTDDFKPYDKFNYNRNVLFIEYLNRNEISEEIFIAALEHSNQPRLAQLLRDAANRRKAKSKSTEETVLNKNISTHVSPVSKETKGEDFLQYPAKVDVYNFAKSKKALSLIINNYDFKPEPRNGSNEDRECLKELLKEKGTYEPIIANDCNHRQMMDELLKFRKDKRLDEVDAVFVCILSHGNDEGIVCVDDIDVKYKFIVDVFKAKFPESPDLTGKPRIFFIQACRIAILPGAKPKSHYLDGLAMAKLLNENDYADAHRTEKDDIMMLLSTGWGEFSYRKLDDSGSFFVSAINTVLRENNNRYDDINTLFRKIRNGVRHQRQNEDGDQDPTMYDNSTHTFYFDRQ